MVVGVFLLIIVVIIIIENVQSCFKAQVSIQKSRRP